MSTETYDVVAVNIETNSVRIIDFGKSLNNAEAIVSMSVMRRGVCEEFFSEAPSGKYVEGDQWRGAA